ncbi:DEAD/DEAH box helicase family protein [Microterricola viridarii]|uniref:Type III restriction enzyme, res subunit n=1 Tax=Microterricola viridarii TaxID=412690 RepID=A0A1H1XJI4_9MICO|nr:DEAD/DEAH box helicase family protein [Microterricola viridarii]SDT09397.1 Type III restriction enzyme, res subunit [Microterricola viridarii]
MHENATTSPTTRAPALPLRDWRFQGTLRGYQAEVLQQVTTTPDDPLHIVAPPGSGKTLLALLLAVRDGRRALALAPTVTIRQQWQRTALQLAPDAEQVSSTPDRLADLTVLTYQMLSIVAADTSPFEDLARLTWVDELVQSGRVQADAEAWLSELRDKNAAQYRSGIRRRSRRVRRQLVQQEPSELARVLHPNALALLENLVEHGVETIILDECHHLLDHWAFVVAYLAGRIRERGGSPHLIGLTATLPSTEDDEAYEIYTQLLGDVDYEVPTPAVVKEGHLAPYRDFAWFTEPIPSELAFIRKHEKRLHTLVGELLATETGIAFLVDKLQPPAADAALGAGSGTGERVTPAPPPAAAPTPDDMLAALDRALAQDFYLARSAGLALREVAPRHPLIGMLPAALLDRCTSDDLLSVLGRYSLERLLTDPEAQPLWAEAKRALADFGYHLTDRGIRRGRNPIELTLATSQSKDQAAATILRHELGRPDGERIRAVVITDFAVHGSQRSTSDGEPAGALRCFASLSADPVIAGLRPVLLTAQLLRVRAADAELLADALSDELGQPVQVEPTDAGAADLNAPGVGSGRLVEAVSALVARGTVRLIVGTRGLLGEGWDCPPVNTLIDLTAVATSSATQQLRGRSLRLDPAWPGKVAHNWSVACLIPANVAIDTPSEMARLRRKHRHLWGLSAEDNSAIISGLGHALHPDELGLLTRLLGKEKGASADQVNSGVLARMRTRAQSHADWRVGGPYAGHEQELVALSPDRSHPVLRSGPTLALLLTTFFACTAAVFGFAMSTLARSGAHSLGAEAVLWLSILLTAVVSGAVFAPAFLRAYRQRAQPTVVYRGAALAIARTLHEAGRVGEFGEGNIVVQEQRSGSGRNGKSVVSGITVEFNGGSAADRAVLADALAELFGPVQKPRFLVRVDRGPIGRLSTVFAGPIAVIERMLPTRTLLSVPAAIGRRKADAELFARHWAKSVGACTLHEVTGVEGVAQLREARAASGRLNRFEPRGRSWA